MRLLRRFGSVALRLAPRKDEIFRNLSLISKDPFYPPLGKGEKLKIRNFFIAD